MPCVILNRLTVQRLVGLLEIFQLILRELRHRPHTRNVATISSSVKGSRCSVERLAGLQLPALFHCLLRAASHHGKQRQSMCIEEYSQLILLHVKPVPLVLYLCQKCVCLADLEAGCLSLGQQDVSFLCTTSFPHELCGCVHHVSPALIQYGILFHLLDGFQEQIFCRLLLLPELLPPSQGQRNLKDVGVTYGQAISVLELPFFAIFIFDRLAVDANESVGTTFLSRDKRHKDLLVVHIP
mmetsp:Transcript_59207/g.108910  ORF Transcript_59207/g.108910 Transcript_59207/m.108910 type:complete len:240 (+) Transcript_59207:1218-1937(+)